MQIERFLNRWVQNITLNNLKLVFELNLKKVAFNFWMEFLKVGVKSYHFDVAGFQNDRMSLRSPPRHCERSMAIST